MQKMKQKYRILYQASSEENSQESTYIHSHATLNSLINMCSHPKWQHILHGSNTYSRSMMDLQ